MPPPHRHDLLIIGAGPAGSAAAILLARQGLSVALCEQKSFPREKVCGEFLGPRARPLLASLGLLEAFDAAAGPAITRLHACSAHRTLSAPLPPDPHGQPARAISRATLDELLLARAAAAGAAIHQPCHVQSVTGSLATGFTATTDAGDLHAKTLLLAHGLAQRGDMQGPPLPQSRTRGYLCFKTHLTNCPLDPSTIAIAGAPGLYAGLVHSSHDRCSLAFVVSRPRLARLGNRPDDHLAALRTENPAFARLLQNAARSDPWLASGPLDPGIRGAYHDGRFFAGNAAGEVHALVGEGITLALNAAALLADAVARHGLTGAAGFAYARGWGRAFLPRYRAAQLFANVMMRPRAAACAAGLLSACPPALRFCVRWAGK